MVGESLTGRIADDFFLMVHDDEWGRPRLPARILGLGLAGALLAELALTGAVRVIKSDVVRPLSAGAPPQFSLLGEVFRELEREKPRPVRDWIDYLGPDAAERVAKRLEAAGLVHFPSPPRIRLPGRTRRWRPTNIQTAGWPAIDVKFKIHNRTADTHHLVLFGLTHATQLDHPSLWEVRDRLQDPLLKTTLSPLSYSPALMSVLINTQEAVNSAVASHRLG